MNLQPIILSGAAVRLAAASEPGKLPRIAIVAYNGGIMRPHGWGALAIDLSALKLSAKTPILADHRAEVGSIIGHGTATVKGGKLLLDGVVSGATPAAAQVVSMAAGGFEFQASVGVDPGSLRFVKPGEKVTVNGRVLSSEQGFDLVTAGKLKEVTVTPLGADDGTSVSIAATRRKGNTMDDNNGAAGAAGSTIDRDSIVAAERERVREIRSICAGYDNNTVNRNLADAVERLKARAMDGEIDLAELRASMLSAIRADRPQGMRPVVPNYGPQGFNKTETLEGAILCRLGFERLAEKTLGAEVTERASSLRATNGVDLCRAALQLGNRDIPNGRDEMIRAAFSSVELPLALGNVATKILLDAYGEAPQAWREFCAIRSVPDFRDAKAIRPTFGGSLEQVAKTGELKHTTVTEFSSDFRVDTFGKVLTIDRRDFIDDNLGVFNDGARAFGAMAMRSVNDLIYGTILANAGSFFSSGNANDTTGVDSALGVDSLGAAIRKMRVQRDSAGNDLDIVPAALVVPPDLETTAKAVLESEFIAQTVAGMPTGNANRQAVKLVVEPRLNNATKFPSGASAKRWFLFAGPQASPVVAAFLNGQQAPTIEYFGLNQEVNRLGLSWRVFMDYGAALCDPNAAVRVKGEA